MLRRKQALTRCLGWEVRSRSWGSLVSRARIAVGVASVRAPNSFLEDNPRKDTARPTKGALGLTLFWYAYRQPLVLVLGFSSLESKDSGNLWRVPALAPSLCASQYHGLTPVLLRSGVGTSGLWDPHMGGQIRCSSGPTPWMS